MLPESEALESFKKFEESNKIPIEENLTYQQVLNKLVISGSSSYGMSKLIAELNESNVPPDTIIGLNVIHKEGSTTYHCRVCKQDITTAPLMEIHDASGCKAKAINECMDQGADKERRSANDGIYQ